MLPPKRLRTGDIIGIISPSGPITSDVRPQLRKGIRTLETLGFRVRLGANALKIDDYSAGTPEERAEDIMSMFMDKAVSAIICSQGGYNSNGCLPLLNWKIIRENPKIFIGMSDITVLINAFHLKTGLITFHGNDVMWGFGRRPTSYDKQEFLDRLLRGKIGRVAKNSEWKSVRDGVSEGKLVGGNLGSLLMLAGTPFFPDFKDSIMFLEAYSPTPAACDYMFNQLEQMGVFDDVRGVIVGHVHGLQAAKSNMIQMEDILLKVTTDYDFPILKLDDFGHECANTVIPVGARALIDAGKTDWKIIEECVRMS